MITFENKSLIVSLSQKAIVPEVRGGEIKSDLYMY